MNAKTPGEKLRLWREHRGFSKAELGKSAGVEGQYVSKIESGKRNSSTANLSKLAKALGCIVDDLL